MFQVGVIKTGRGRRRLGLTNGSERARRWSGAGGAEGAGLRGLGLGGAPVSPHCPGQVLGDPSGGRRTVLSESSC